MLKYEKDYNEAGQRILDEGVMLPNERTGKGCLTVINQDFVYDVGAGDIPLLTNKQCFSVSAIAEVLGYYRQYKDAQQFADIGTKSWLMNSNENSAWVANPNRRGANDMGEAYRFGAQGYTVEVTPSVKPTPDKILVEQEFKKIFYETLPSVEDYIGVHFESSSCGEYKVKEFRGYSPDKRITYLLIEFIATGTELVIQKSQIRNGNIKDYATVSVYGVGTLGCTIKDDDKILYKTWSHMLERCYCTYSKHYKSYGGRGVFVSEQWLNFSVFKEDVKVIPNYYMHKEYPKKYTLDKDFYHSNYYSKHTCKWASKKEQAINRCSSKTYLCHSDDGEAIYLKGIGQVADFLGVGYDKAWKLTKSGEISTSERHTSYVEVNPNLSIYCKLKNGVDDRGLIATAWLPHLEQVSCLRACAYEHIWSLVGNKLSLTVTQRSGDFPLGIPFNSFSFCFLLKLMAKITGNIPDKVYHKVINVHIYDDQIEIFKGQLSRTPLDITPTLEIADWVTCLDDVVGNDIHARDYFTLTGYEHQGKIVYPFSE